MFDEDFVPNPYVAAAVTNAQQNDPNQYLDTGAIDHITDELEQLTTHERYNGVDQVCAANRASTNINHIGESVIPTSCRPLQLNHVLHTHK